MKYTAIYVRVSSSSQDTASQEPDLKAYCKSIKGKVVWYTDKASGKNMDRPGWNKLETAVRQGKVSSVVVWRIDRLGRTARGLTALFEDLGERKVNLVSIRDGLDLSTPAGRLMANVLASVAQYETEVRGERVREGIKAAKAKGKTWGGSKPGVLKIVTDTQVRSILKAKNDGESVTAIALAFKLSRPTIYRVLKLNA